MSEVRLIDANKIYEQIAEKEELARQRVIDTPSRLPNGEFNPFATQYATQLDERTRFKFMIADAPTIDAKPIVRCIDCRWHEHSEPGMVWCPIIEGSWIEENFFCAYGAKMEEVTE